MPESSKPVRRPRLSELGIDLLRLTNWQRTRAETWPFVAFFSYWIFAWSEHWVLAVFSLVVLSFVTYGSTSHDLVHGSLGLKRLPNDLLLSAIELISLRSGHAYQLAHLNHHARFPRHDDIEAQAARLSLVGVLLEGVVFQVRIYAWALRHPRGRRRWIIAEGIGVAAIILAALASLPWTIVPGVYAGLMIAGSWTIPLVTSYFPHDANAPDALRQTRLFRGWIARIVAFDHLYHLEHHLYPAVPHQNWPRLARRLDPWLAAAGVKPVRIGR
ncbi:MAG TPA: fatty acid desaturase [Pirellulales bacterium]|nr:fatty acid desaturase [Pirellulales bacterium]